MADGHVRECEPGEKDTRLICRIVFDTGEGCICGDPSAGHQNSLEIWPWWPAWVPTGLNRGNLGGTRDPTRESAGGLFKGGRRVRGPNPDAALYETLDSFLPPVLLLTAARVIWRPVRL